MPLPSDDEIKAYLRVETDVEDDLIFAANNSAQAMVLQYLKVPLESTSRTFKGRRPRRGHREELTERLVIPVVPCATTAVITDLDGTVVDADTYTIDGRYGWVDAVRYEAFDNPPYQIVVSVGWPHDEEYGAEVDPLLYQIILDIAVDIYRRRNTGAIYEQSGGQVSITYTADDIPARPRVNLELLRARALPARAW
jgi:hypothetical protein